jgi:dihydroorotate dehydrogenase
MLYRIFVRPLLFIFEPESVHNFAVLMLRIVLYFPGMQTLLKFCFGKSEKILERELFGIKFRNPVGLAAGFDKNARHYNDLSSFGFSFIEIGTVTPLAQPGNPKPRSFRLPRDKALVNRMGINNQGAEKIARNLRKYKPKIVIGGNIGKNTLTPNNNAIDDYVKCFNVLHEVVDYFVVNVSCPNIGDIKELQDADTLLELLSVLQGLSAKKPVPKPILLKISPDLNYHQLDELIEIAKKTRIAGFVATNTTVFRDNLKTSARRIRDIGKGGLSGLPLRARSTEVIRYLVEKSEGKIPVIGVGGIMSARDAIEKLNAGASLVQLYTGFIYEGPSLIKKINKEIIRNKH